MENFTGVISSLVFWLSSVLSPIVIQFLKGASRIPLGPQSTGPIRLVSAALALLGSFLTLWADGRLAEFDWTKLTDLIQFALTAAANFLVQWVSYRFGLKPIYGAGLTMK